MSRALLAELETLCHADRIRRVIELGKKARTSAPAARTLATLADGPFYQRLLAVYACYGSGDGAMALRFLSDTSHTIRRMAIRPLALFGSDKQLRQALASADQRTRRTLLARLRDHRRFAPIDAFLDDLARRQDRDLETLLPLGSPAVVARHLTVGVERGGITFWQRLTRSHPDLALEIMRKRANEIADVELLAIVRVAVNTLAEKRPDAVLELVQHFTLRVPLAQLNFIALARRRTDAVTDLLCKLPVIPGSVLTHVAERLDPARLRTALARGLVAPPYFYQNARPPRWLRRLPPERRASLYQEFGTGWANNGLISPALLSMLPAPLRQAEARRHLALPELATQPLLQIPYATLLPWDEARTVLNPWIRHPDGEMRGPALAALCGTLRYERGRAAEFLALVRARRHEQDPVRLQMLGALVALPPAVWQAEHLDDLGAVLRDALNAADLSHATASFAEQLVFRLLQGHTAWAVEWLTTLVRERGRIHLPVLESRFNNTETPRIITALMPVLRAWDKREREWHTLQLASSLGRRLPAAPMLLDLVERIARSSRMAGINEQALALLFRHVPERAGRLVVELLRADPSWIVLGSVHRYLHRHRQDLLTPFLGRQPIRGRFSTGKVRWILPLQKGFFRWTASQQETFTLSLQEVVDHGDTMRDIPSVLTALRQLAALPAAPRKPLIRLAADPRPAVQETALRALGGLDDGSGTGTLIEALGDDRARVAIYALRAALRDTPDAHALDLLRRAPMERVTVAKEIVRLVGDRHTPAAFDFLREVDGQSLHRDVRIALLRALWEHLEQPAAWPILERAVADDDAALMTAVVRIPTDRLSGTARNRLLSLLASLLIHPDATVRVEVLRRCQTLPILDPERRLLPGLLTAVGSRLPNERATAAGALLAWCSDAEVDAVVERVQELLPNRRALRTFVDTLQSALGTRRERLGRLGRRVLATLANDPLTRTLQVELAVAILEVRELVDFLGQFAREPETLPIALPALVYLSRFTSEEIRELESLLARSRSATLRRLALGILTTSSDDAHGWTEERLTRLRAFRTDRSPLVAEAAQFTFPDTEDV
jgi:hypothetical protein